MIGVDRISLDIAARFVEPEVVGATVDAWTVHVDGELVLIAGVARETLLGEAELWLVTGPFFKHHRLATCRALRDIAAWIREQYPTLYVRSEDGKLPRLAGMKFIRLDVWPDGRCWRKYK